MLIEKSQVREDYKHIFIQPGLLNGLNTQRPGGTQAFGFDLYNWLIFRLIDLTIINADPCCSDYVAGLPSSSFVIPVGAVDAPGAYFNGDSNTGFYWIAANNFGATANGAKVLDIGVNGLGVTGALSYTTFLTHGLTTGITAFAGGGQASAVALTTDLNNVTVCATAGDSVKLPSAAAGLDIFIKNTGAAALDIFPATGDSINALAVNLAIRIQPASSVRFIAQDATVWRSSSDFSFTLNSPTTLKGQLELKATDSTGNTVTTITNALQAAARTYTIPDAGASASFLMTQGAQTIVGVQTFSAGQVMGLINTYAARQALTALAGGAQAGTALTTEYNEFTTVATAADSAQLPVAVLGKKVIVKNSAAKTMAVFGQTGDAIDGASANASFAVQPGQEVIFEAITATTWQTKEGTSLGTISSVTQATSITTGVTVNSKKGIITTFAPSTAALGATTFTVTCNKTTATSNIRAYVTEYGGTVLTNGLPYVFVKNQTATSFDIIVYNAHATNALATSMKIGFEIVN